jgi:hypothetical protein
MYFELSGEDEIALVAVCGNIGLVVVQPQARGTGRHHLPSTNKVPGQSRVENVGSRSKFESVAVSTEIEVGGGGFSGVFVCT